MDASEAAVSCQRSAFSQKPKSDHPPGFDARRGSAYGPIMTRGGVMLLALSLAMIAARAGAQVPPAAAPGATDIGERLARLEEGQRSLEKRLDDFRADINRRFDEQRDFIIWGFG